MLAALPKSAHPGALAAIKDIDNAEDIDKAQVAIKAFEIAYGTKYSKAVALPQRQLVERPVGITPVDPTATETITAGNMRSPETSPSTGRAGRLLGDYDGKVLLWLLPVSLYGREGGLRQGP